MRLALLVVALLGTSASAETFDITSFTPPAGWSAQRDKGAVTYTTVDERAKTFCRLQVYASLKATANARADFDNEWRMTVQYAFKKAGTPTMGDVADDDGWKMLAGGTQTEFDGKPTTVMLLVASRDGRRVAIEYAATGDCSAQFDAFAKTISFAAPKPTVVAPVAAATSDWRAVAKADWVEVTSTAGKVLIHYPSAVTSKYESVFMTSVRTAWNTLVAPHYGSITNLELKPIQSYESVTFAEADAVEKGSNRSVHVVLFKLHDYNDHNRYLEFVTDSKATFEKNFGPYHKDEFHWEKLTKLGNYDRFDVTKAGLAGTWSSTDFTSVQYYYASTGRSAGANATAMADEFTFDGKGGYSSDSASASGAVGNAKFSRQQYRGAYSIEGGIKLTLTNRFQGAPETYTAYFQAVKGGNALVLMDSRNSFKYLAKKT